MKSFLFSVENENHCDFTKLREMLIRTNMEDLRDTTHSKHYELYRKDRLKDVSNSLILHVFTLTNVVLIYLDGIQRQRWQARLR